VLLASIHHSKAVNNLFSTVPQKEANWLVEEFMLLANMTTARMVADAWPDRCAVMHAALYAVLHAARHAGLHCSGCCGRGGQWVEVGSYQIG